MKHTYLQILNPIKEKHGNQLNPELISLKIVQSKEVCWVHSEYRDESGVLHIEDLDFIAEDDLFDLSEIINVSFFNPLIGIEENARRFIEELDAYTLAICFDRIIGEDVF